MANGLPSRRSDLRIGTIGIDLGWLDRLLARVGHQARIDAVGKQVPTDSRIAARELVASASDQRVETRLGTMGLPHWRQT